MVLGRGGSKFESIRSESVLGGLETVFGIIKGCVIGHVIHNDRAFSTAFPKLSTVMG
jgi:hypothetical protein